MVNQNDKITVNEFLKNRILWRIYFMWFLRRILPLIILQVAIFTLAVRIFANNVFVRQAFRNAYWVSASSYWSLLTYGFFAFLNARPLTQLAILVILGVTALLLRDLLKILLTYKAMWLRK